MKKIGHVYIHVYRICTCFGSFTTVWVCPMKFRITLNHLYDKYITPQGKNHLILINNDKEIISLMYVYFEFTWYIRKHTNRII